MNGLKICISQRCFYPKGAFFYSSKKIAKLARDVGYEGVEFFPTWRVCWEEVRYGKLLVQDKFISSFHRDWRFDRLMEARIKGKPDWWFQLREKVDWLFPLSNTCLSALKKFQEAYKVPVSTIWFSDTKNFSPVMLELWSKKQGIDQKGLMRWLAEDSENRGVVVDTAKVDSWLESNGLERKKKEVIESLLPHTFEVHYRVKGKIASAVKIGEEKLSGLTTENLRLILKMGYKGRIVVEFGWPDLENPPFGLVREDLIAFRRLHSQIISIIRSG